MATYSVGCHQIEHFKFNVEADSEEEALIIAKQKVEDEGVPRGAKVFDREFDSVQANKVKNVNGKFKR